MNKIWTEAMAVQEDDLFSEGAKKLRKLIKEKNIKPTDVVNALGVSKETLSKWVQESTPANAQHLVELAKVLSAAERWVSDAKDGKKSENFKQHPLKDELALKDATPEQLISELKSRYAALNLKAEIKVTVEPIEGGFVVKDI